MKYTFLFTIFFTLLLSSCSRKNVIIKDLSSNVDEVVSLEIRGDHKTIIPNGNAAISFTVLAYGSRKVQTVYREGTVQYTKDSIIRYQIPTDLIKDFVKICDETGNALANNTYSALGVASGTVKRFYARCGDVKSPELTITVRQKTDENYEEVVVPVIFHLLVPHATNGPTYRSSVEYLEKALERASDIFNRKATTDPNGGTAKIIFRLAEYDKNGIRLAEKGKNTIQLSAAQGPAATATPAVQLSTYKTLILGNYLWDPNKYLNIWLVTMGDISSSYANGTRSAVTSAPRYITTSGNASKLLGVTMAQSNIFSASMVTDCSTVGIMLSWEAFFNPAAQGTNEFELSTYLGQFYGLLFTDYNDNNRDVNNDNDYCEDTYRYNSSYFANIYKNNRWSGEPANGQYDWFTSFNIMDRYSRKNSITADQAKRVRAVLDMCPDRWQHKSTYAFVGK